MASSKLQTNAHELRLAPETRRNFAVIVPAFNEVENIPDLITEFKALFDKYDLAGDLILVDDGLATGATMQAAFRSQGSEGIVKARAVEDRLMIDTWQNPRYDLLPKLRNLRIPTLVIAGDKDFFPLEVSTHIADALPNAKLVTTKDCGHFAFLECPGEVRNALRGFLKSPRQ